MRDHQEHRLLDHAESLPSLLAVLNPIQHRHVKGVTKHLRSLLKGKAVLALVGEVPGLVPLEPEVGPDLIVFPFSPMATWLPI